MGDKLRNKIQNIFLPKTTYSPPAMTEPLSQGSPKGPSKGVSKGHARRPSLVGATHASSVGPPSCNETAATSHPCQNIHAQPPATQSPAGRGAPLVISNPDDVQRRQQTLESEQARHELLQHGIKVRDFQAEADARHDKTVECESQAAADRRMLLRTLRNDQNNESAIID